MRLWTTLTACILQKDVRVEEGKERVDRVNFDLGSRQEKGTQHELQLIDNKYACNTETTIWWQP
jgi:hypothetical protein